MLGARSTRRRRAGFRVLLTAALTLMTSAVSAEKTDVIVLSNGDTITGEVKSLVQGQVKLKTDDAGTIYIEWDSVDFATSKSFFEVENSEGDFFYGSLGAGTEKQNLHVIGPDSTVTLDMASVVEIVPIKQTFWDRIDGNLSLGLTYNSADESLQYTLDAEATYRQRKYSETVSLNSTETRRDGTDPILRDSLEFTYTRYHNKRYYGSGTLAFTRNTELGLDLRTELAYSFGRAFSLTNRSVFSGDAGFSISRENPSGVKASGYIGWAVFSLNYHFFLYNFPRTDFEVDVTVQPGITEWPRTRADLSASIRREIIKDFTVNLSASDTYDSEPGSDEAIEKNDFVLVLSVGWAF